MKPKVQEDELEEITMQGENPVDETFSPLTTIMCTDLAIDDVCAAMGSISSKWGYFESEVIFIISKRLDFFFKSTLKKTTENQWTTKGLYIKFFIYHILKMLSFFFRL